MAEIVALGELLIDFTPCGRGSDGQQQYEANPGGAPCNMLAAAEQLGHNTAFIGKVGTDNFGIYLKGILEGIGIDTSGLVMSDEYFTTLAFVSLDKNGDRSFSFARKYSADIMLASDEVPEKLIADSRIFHCGTLSLTNPSCKDATLKALKTAKENNICISVDPNLREPLWDDRGSAKAAIRTVLSYADVAKLSDYEMEYLYGFSSIPENIDAFLKEFAPKILFVTCGRDGAYLVTNGMRIHSPCYDVETIDTTGAGDCFCGAALSYLLEYQLDFDALDDEKCRHILQFANAAASLATTKRGGIPAMPNREDVLRLLSTC